MAKFEIVDVKTVDQLDKLQNLSKNSNFIGSEGTSNTLKHIAYDTLSSNLYNNVSAELSISFFDGNYYDKNEVNDISAKLQQKIDEKAGISNIPIATTLSTGGFIINPNQSESSKRQNLETIYMLSVNNDNKIGYAIIRDTGLDEQISGIKTIKTINNQLANYNYSIQEAVNTANDAIKIANSSNGSEIQSDIQHIAEINTECFGTKMRQNYLQLDVDIQELFDYLSASPNNVLSILTNDGIVPNIDDETYKARINSLVVDIVVQSTDDDVFAYISATTISSTNSSDELSSGTISKNIGQINQQISSIINNSISLTSYIEDDILSAIGTGLSDAVCFKPDDFWRLQFKYTPENVEENYIGFNKATFVDSEYGEYDGNVSKQINYLSSKIDNLNDILITSNNSLSSKVSNISSSIFNDDSGLSSKVDTNTNNISSLSTSNYGVNNTYAYNVRSSISSYLSSDLKKVNFLQISDLSNNDVIAILSSVLADYFEPKA